VGLGQRIEPNARREDDERKADCVRTSCHVATSTSSLSRGVAAACYARASERFYNWLLNNRTFGPTIREWRRHRSIPYRTKLTAIVMMSLTLTSSIVFFVRNPYLQAALALLGATLAVWLYRIPSRDRPRTA
jgi:uncharacterized membrane protein YbaN (DUF454 family)